MGCSNSNLNTSNAIKVINSVESVYKLQADSFFDTLQGGNVLIRLNRDAIIIQNYADKFEVTGFGRNRINYLNTVKRDKTVNYTFREYKIVKDQNKLFAKVTAFVGDDIKDKKSGIPLYYELTFDDRYKIISVESWLLEKLPKFDDLGWPSEIESIISKLPIRNGKLDLNDKVFNEDLKDLKTQLVQFAEKEAISLIENKIKTEIHGILLSI